jgi:hypothetical protein
VVFVVPRNAKALKCISAAGEGILFSWQLKHWPYLASKTQSLELKAPFGESLVEVREVRR